MSESEEEKNYAWPLITSERFTDYDPNDDHLGIEQTVLSGEFGQRKNRYWGKQEISEIDIYSTVEDLIFEGLTAKDIAKQVGVSYNYVIKVKRDLGHNRTNYKTITIDE